MKRKTKKVFFAALLIVIALPAALVLTGFACFSIMEQDQWSDCLVGCDAPIPAVRPENLRPVQSNAIVISIHPAATWPALQMNNQPLERSGRAIHGFIVVYTNCAENAEVILYTVEGGGHTWPGGEPLAEWIAGPTTNNINASSVMWEFYSQHPLGN